MKHSIAAAPPETWNQKNLPSDIERFEQSPGQTEWLRDLPRAAWGLARRRQGILWGAIAAIGIFGLIRAVSRRGE